MPGFFRKKPGIFLAQPGFDPAAFFPGLRRHDFYLQFPDVLEGFVLAHTGHDLVLTETDLTGLGGVFRRQGQFAVLAGQKANALSQVPGQCPQDRLFGFPMLFRLGDQLAQRGWSPKFVEAQFLIVF